MKMLGIDRLGTQRQVIVDPQTVDWNIAITSP
jgi:hypothetical protein